MDGLTFEARAQEIKTIKIKIKKWERDFEAKKGVKPTSADIRSADASIKALYKKHSKLRKTQDEVAQKEGKPLRSSGSSSIKYESTSEMPSSKTPKRSTDRVARSSSSAASPRPSSAKGATAPPERARTTAAPSRTNAAAASPAPQQQAAPSNAQAEAIRKLEAENTQLKEKVKMVSLDRDELKKHAIEAERANEEVFDLKKMLKDQNKESAQQKKKMEGEIASLCEKIHRLEDEAAREKEERGREESVPFEDSAEREELLEQVNALKLQAKRKDVEIQRLAKTNEELSSQASSAKREEHHAHSSASEEMEARLNKLEADAAKKSQAVQEWKEKHKTAQREASRLKDAHGVLEQLNQSLREELEMAEAQHTQLKDSLREQEDALASERRTTDELRSDIAELRAKLAQAQRPEAAPTPTVRKTSPPPPTAPSTSTAPAARSHAPAPEHTITEAAPEDRQKLAHPPAKSWPTPPKPVWLGPSASAAKPTQCVHARRCLRLRLQRSKSLKSSLSRWKKNRRMRASLSQKRFNLKEWVFRAWGL